MQAPNAQGIMGLMSQGRAPQQPQQPQGAPQQPQQPMPSPGKASPMAGLGSVEDRVSAYRGNPAPLQQRYAMSQDLLDLLALQKLKSEKDAAARQMQLAMGQQDAQQGMESMTVAQQREKEVTELTKNELAQQRGDTAGQQVQEQQKSLQQAMSSGIASAPGASAVAQPKMMATGGIVAFAEGGDTGTALDSAKEQRRTARDRVYGFGTLERRKDPEGFARAQQELQAAETAVATAEQAFGKTMEATGVSRPAFNRNDVGAAKLAMGATATPPPAPPAPTALPTALPTAPPAATATTTGRPPPAALPGATATTTPPRAAAPPPAAAPPRAAAPTTPPDDFASELRAAALTNAKINPAERQLAEEERVEQRMALTPEQRKVFEDRTSGLQKMYDQQYNPERTRREQISRALIGAGGRRYGEFGAAAIAGLDYAAQQRASQMQDFNALQTSREGIVGLDRANVKGGIEAGQKTFDMSSRSQQQGVASGVNIFNINSDTRNKALDREIDKLKISASNSATAAARDATAAQREGLGQEKARGLYSTTMGRVAEFERRIDSDFNNQYSMLLFQEQQGKLTDLQRKQLEIGKLELKQAKDKVRKEMDPALKAALAKMGSASSDGFGEVKKVPK